MQIRDGQTPAAWPTSLLGEVATITLGGTPSTLVPSFWGGEIPWMASGDVNLKHVWYVDGRITLAGLASSNATLVDPPAVAIGLAGQGKTRGTAALVHIRLCTNQSIALIAGDPDRLDTGFLFHNLDSRYEELRARSSGGGRAGLSRRVLSEVPLGLPPVAEQRCVARILDTLDEAIRKTEGIIAKLQQVKQGLLHDLLTRGIDENGDLRDPERHPEQFKESVVGRIPKDWMLVRLADVVSQHGGLIQTGPFGSQLHAHEYVSDGTPVVMPQDIRENGIDLGQIARVTAKRANELCRHRLVPNDVIFARRGDLSRCAAVSEREGGWLCGTGCLLVRVPSRIVLASWLSMVYRHDRGQRQILSRAVGSTMVNLNTAILSSLLLPLPEVNEQQRIQNVAYSWTTRMQGEQARLAKLGALKLGLMDDLLTGRVRVSTPERVSA